jgi:hypothetical protein
VQKRKEQELLASNQAMMTRIMSKTSPFAKEVVIKHTDNLRQKTKDRVKIEENR